MFRRDAPAASEKQESWIQRRAGVHPKYPSVQAAQSHDSNFSSSSSCLSVRLALRLLPSSFHICRCNLRNDAAPAENLHNTSPSILDGAFSTTSGDPSALLQTPCNQSCLQHDANRSSSPWGVHQCLGSSTRPICSGFGWLFQASLGQGVFSQVLISVFSFLSLETYSAPRICERTAMASEVVHKTGRANVEA